MPSMSCAVTVFLLFLGSFLHVDIVELPKVLTNTNIAQINYPVSWQSQTNWAGVDPNDPSAPSVSMLMLDSTFSVASAKQYLIDGINQVPTTYKLLRDVEQKLGDGSIGTRIDIEA